MQIPATLKTQAALAVLAVIGLVLVKRNLTGIVANAGSAAVEIIADTGAGVAIGVGDIIGIPRTNETECQKAMREGRTLDASFACPAGTFLHYTIYGYIDTTNKGLQ